MSIPTKPSSKPGGDTTKPKKSRSKGIAARQGAKTNILTPSELETAEALSKALVSQMGSKLALDNARQEIGRRTGEIAKLGFARGNIVWAEARKLSGFPGASTLTAPPRR
jgi:hypothetical protein